MTVIFVEGFKVEVERQPDSGFVASVPDLPGCSIQVEKKEQIHPEIARAIGVYLRELASRKPPLKSPGELIVRNGEEPRKKMRM